ncbi:MAG: YciI family protein [Actinobacteria bacterium]|nr:MAG: YciI family protein [Actinomycetota bacterium]
MEYMLLIYMDESQAAGIAPEQLEEHADAFGAYVRELMDRGVIRGGAPLQPQSVATTVKVRDGKTMTTDGPFLETKEGLAGFYLLDCKDLDEAIELAAKVPAAQVGSIEVRPVWQEMVDMVGKRLG